MHTEYYQTGVDALLSTYPSSIGSSFFEMDGPDCMFCDCESEHCPESFPRTMINESECTLKDEPDAYVLEGEAFDELNVADTGFAEDVIQIALDSGAGEHVANRNIAPSYSIKESPGSKTGHTSLQPAGPESPTKASSNCAFAAVAEPEVRARTLSQPSR